MPPCQRILPVNVSLNPTIYVLAVDVHACMCTMRDACFTHLAPNKPGTSHDVAVTHRINDKISGIVVTQREGVACYVTRVHVATDVDLAKEGGMFLDLQSHSISGAQCVSSPKAYTCSDRHNCNDPRIHHTTILARACMHGCVWGASMHAGDDGMSSQQGLRIRKCR